MRLAIDATALSAGRKKGFGVFLEKFIDHVDGHQKGLNLFLYVDEKFSADATKRWPRMSVHAVKSKPGFLWEHFSLPQRVKADKATTVLTGLDRTVLEPVCKTVMFLFEIPDYREKAVLAQGRLYARLAARARLSRFRKVANSVTRFIASSQSTKNDLETCYGVKRERIEVVYPGLDPRFCPASDGRRLEIRQQLASGLRYVLHFATGDYRDNTEMAMKVFSRTIHILQNFALILVGVPESMKLSFKKMSERYGIDGHTRILGFVSQEDLLVLYQGADAYLDPTRYEGFGFQLLEAMGCGVPIIASDTMSVPEVVGDCGFLCQSDDVDGFVRCLVNVLSDPVQWERMRWGGIERAKGFNWDECVTQTLRVCCDV